jgi:hypothetical protein
MSWPTYKPQLWLKFISSSESELHLNVLLPDGLTLGEGPSETEDDFTIRRRTIRFEASGTPGSDLQSFERVVYLDEATGYDPVLDDIVLEIYHDGERKGKGTSHQSEGDTSGDD